MPGVYVHYFNNQSALELLQHFGIEPPKDGKQSKLAPIVCPNCKTEAEPAAKFCSNVSCRMPLTQEGFQQIREDEKKMVEETVEKKVQEILARVDLTKLKGQ
jgi:hypothetical protein